jgi:hypothetical protein
MAATRRSRLHSYGRSSTGRLKGKGEFTVTKMSVKTVEVDSRMARWFRLRQLLGPAAIALLAAALLAPTALAAKKGYWEGEWSYVLPHGATGQLKLKEDEETVKGRYFDNEGKVGKISGDLFDHREVWRGTYRNTTDEDRGSFRVKRDDADGDRVFRGWFKSKFGDEKLDWYGIKDES